jgi:hypothetical protein
MPDIRITVDGRRAFTVDLAAAEFGLSHDAMRKALDRAAVQPLDARLWRQPLYPAKDVRAALSNRKGRGAPGVPRPHKPPA